MTRHPVLRPGDTLRLGGATHTVVGLDSATVRLADVTGGGHGGAHRWAARRFQPGARYPFPGAHGAAAGPGPAAPRRRQRTRVVGAAPDRADHRDAAGQPAGHPPRPEYDPARRSLRQRELAKHDEPTLAGHRVGLSTLKRLRARTSGTACGA